jgi:hypothetical protein
MSLLQENIVYIWIFPVVAQIFIPLAMLAGWSIKRVLSALSRNKINTQIFDRKELETAGIAA